MVDKAAFFTVQVAGDVHDGLQAFIEHRDEPPHGRMSPDEAVSVIVRDWLMGQGYIALPSDPEPITTALEAADVPQH